VWGKGEARKKITRTMLVTSSMTLRRHGYAKEIPATYWVHGEGREAERKRSTWRRTENYKEETKKAHWAGGGKVGKKGDLRIPKAINQKDV